MHAYEIRRESFNISAFIGVSPTSPRTSLSRLNAADLTAAISLVECRRLYALHGSHGCSQVLNPTTLLPDLRRRQQVKIRHLRGHSACDWIVDRRRTLVHFWMPADSETVQ